MIRVVGVHRAQHAEVVGEPGGVGKELADLKAAASVPRVSERRIQEAAGLPLGAELGALGTLPLELREGGLGVHEIGSEGTAIHEEMDHPLGPGGELRSGPRPGLKGPEQPKGAHPCSHAAQGSTPVDGNWLVRHSMN